MPELHKAIARLMADRQEPKVAEPDVPALRTLLDLMLERVPPKEQPLLEGFTRALFSREGESLLGTEDTAHLAGMTLSAFRFFCARGEQPYSARVYVPDMERDGWASVHTVVETVLTDRAFIVDTLRETIQDAGGDIRLLLHPILGVTRADGGELTEIVPSGRGRALESFVHIEVAHLRPGSGLEELLSERLSAVVLATDDYTAMLDRASHLAEELRRPGLSQPWSDEAHETAAFLDWLANESFIFLGYREYDIEREGRDGTMVVRKGSGLGILREESRSEYITPQAIEADDLYRINQPPLLVVGKTAASSPVHRLEGMDSIDLKVVGHDGGVIGERRFLGLLTSQASQEPSSAIPIMRDKLRQVLDQEGVVEESHDYRNLAGLFNSFPKEELLSGTVSEIRDALRVINSAEGQSSIRVISRWDAHRLGLFLTVILPKARFSTELHERVSARVRDHLEATILDQCLVLDERMQARLHYHLLLAPAVSDTTAGEMLQQDLNLLLRTWEDQLRHELAETHSPPEADRLVKHYGAAFPPGYKARTSVADAITDIRCLERLVATGAVQVEIERREGAEATALKLFLAGERIILSDFIPVLENLGLRVLNEQFIEMSLPKADQVRIHTFLVQDAADHGRSLSVAAPRIDAALAAIRGERVESDPLNSLVLRAGLDWRAVDLLRAYGEHARQIGVVAGRAALVEALAGHPEQARLLYGVFAARFDPASSPGPDANRAKTLAQAQAEFLSSLEGVESLVHDRVLRALCGAVMATVRTNFFSHSLTGPEAETIAVKFDCSQLPHLPDPRPMFETYVHGPRVEGIHLRGGAVARGGIRYSDRPDDFRSEILGLMKTQSVKNAVIVPVGAKGGFIVKGRAGTRAPGPEDVDFSYRAFIGSLLSITDNVRNDRVIPPAGQVAYDGEDPYLVVAADRGTATFSDTANEVAARYNFWLGDAFASGGSHGYDHKKYGITARGAWECVRHHFREMGRDVNREPVTVIGIGDMSGDVFGNGLLQSRTIRLLAAFNHKHIFLDPDPDPEASYAERERLFRMPRSSWSDYDSAVLSAGGGVYARNAKSIPLEVESRKMLGIEDVAPAGEDVVKLILRMEADLLWNGGIGTYVKASDETDADAHDPANDTVRIDAAELRVKAVGEGGNLGFTQRARIAFAISGGWINTDAIDNSGGVDLSDHEVNLKIALDVAVAGNEISVDERNRLLEELGPEVVEAVMIHNRRQAVALSLDQHRSREKLAMFRTHAARLESKGGLDRRLEHVPTREALRARRTAFLGLTRPELAVLLGYSKLNLQRELVNSPLCSDADLDYFFNLYFPTAVKERFGHLLARHPLRREITAVELANQLVDSMGMTFVTRVAGHTGHETVEILRAWVAAAAISGANTLIEEISTMQPPLPFKAEAECHFMLEHALERATKWMLETQPPSAPIRDLTGAFTEPVQLLLSAWPDLLDGEAGGRFRAETERLMNLGLAEPMALCVNTLARTQDALEIAHIAREADAPLPVTTEAYLGLLDLVDIDWIRDTLTQLAGGEGRWEQRAVEGLLEGLVYARRHITREVLRLRGDGDEETGVYLNLYAEERRAQLTRLNKVVDDQKVAKQLSLAAILVVMRELGRLAGHH